MKDIVLFAAFHAKGDTITATDISFNLSDTSILSELHLKNEVAEKQRITDALKRTAWNKTQAAKLLNISRPTLDYKIKQFDIRKTEV
ncbi:helix-turn-helix domain-containing protein [Duncaniella freteri]|uniref:helix-turn-helix domain-containing protein n=1 Tax=Duncaniella freteri TaxID=2530391 RepID=UPI0025790C5E|nr:helix-turn-helix domain-containing protein [Duncaniella freteri]